MSLSSPRSSSLLHLLPPLPPFFPPFSSSFFRPRPLDLWLFLSGPGRAHLRAGQHGLHFKAGQRASRRRFPVNGTVGARQADEGGILGPGAGGARSKEGVESLQ